MDGETINELEEGEDAVVLPELVDGVVALAAYSPLIELPE
jgi:hypothetical protein